MPTATGQSKTTNTKFQTLHAEFGNRIDKIDKIITKMENLHLEDMDAYQELRTRRIELVCSRVFLENMSDRIDQ